jgi:tetratricopeptide (TPR) repeat protein
VLGLAALDRNELATAREHLEQAHAYAGELDLDDAVARTNGNLADLAMTCGDHDQARQRWERNLAHPILPWRESHTRWGLGTLARRDGRLDEADDHFARTLQVADAIGFPHYVAIACVGLAAVAADRGNYAECRILLERADAVLEVAGIELTGIDAEAYREAHRTTLAEQEPGEPVTRAHDQSRGLTR